MSKKKSTASKKVASKPPRKRRTALEIEQCQAAMEALLDDGYTPASVIRAIAEQYGLSIRQAERYYQTIMETGSVSKWNTQTAQLHGDHYRKGRRVYRSCVQKGDDAGALKALEFIDNIVERAEKRGGKQFGPAATEIGHISPGIETFYRRITESRDGGADNEGGTQCDPQNAL